MNVPELNELARELRDNDRIESAVLSGFGEGNYKTATSVGLEVVGEFAPQDLTDAINYDDDVTVSSLRSNIDGDFEATVFLKK